MLSDIKAAGAIAQAFNSLCARLPLEEMKTQYENGGLKGRVYIEDLDTEILFIVRKPEI